jgi:hypothetical protein
VYVTFGARPRPRLFIAVIDTADEKDKFLDDATRLGIAITVNQTYAPVAPLLNFWGAFTPSVDSGIGVGGKPKKSVDV